MNSFFLDWELHVKQEQQNPKLFVALILVAKMQWYLLT